FFEAEDGIRYRNVTGVQTCALPICNLPIKFYHIAFINATCTRCWLLRFLVHFIMYSRIIHSMEVIETQPENDYVKIGQRIRAARLEKGYSQADLGALVGCSKSHMSHVEVGQTKVALAMLLKLAFVLEKNFDYFLLDTPYAKCDSIIDNEIAAKLKKCNVTTLITVGKLIDVLIDQQEMIKKAELD